MVNNRLYYVSRYDSLVGDSRILGVFNRRYEATRLFKELFEMDYDGIKITVEEDEGDLFTPEKMEEIINEGYYYVDWNLVDEIGGTYTMVRIGELIIDYDYYNNTYVGDKNE